MPHSFGYRARTRDLFKRKFRHHGTEHLSSTLRTYKVGDYVDILANSSIADGMPHKFYHGKQGVVFNVTRRALGLRIRKFVKGVVFRKSIHVRVEHVRPSKCQNEIKSRVAANEANRIIAKASGKHFQMKRLPKQPNPAHFVSLSSPATTITLQPYVDVV